MVVKCFAESYTKRRFSVLRFEIQGNSLAVQWLGPGPSGLGTKILQDVWRVAQPKKKEKGKEKKKAWDQRPLKSLNLRAERNHKGHLVEFRLILEFSLQSPVILSILKLLCWGGLQCFRMALSEGFSLSTFLLRVYWLSYLKQEDRCQLWRNVISVIYLIAFQRKW